MKNWFLVQLFFAAIDAAGGGSQEPKPLTSEKLETLKADYARAWAIMLSNTDPFAKETKDAKLAVWKIEGEIKAEEAAILKLQNEAKIAEQRSERLRLNTDQITALTALIAERAKKTPDTAKVAELETAFNTAKEAVDNELLAKFAHSRPAKVATEGDKQAGESGANKEAILEMARAGKTHKEIETEGNFKRSTVWHAINNAKKAGETFPNA